MIDFRFQYGKHPARHDPAMPKLSAFVGSKLSCPASIDWGAKVPSWPMDHNDTAGTCTLAGIAHLIQLWSTNAGVPVIVPDDVVLALYEQLTGYDPSTGANDNGYNELDLLNLWQSAGVFGNKILGKVSVDWKNRAHVMAGIYTFGGLYAGMQIPKSAEQQFSVGQPWTRTWFSPIAGLHCVPLTAYGIGGPSCITWAREQLMSWEFLATYCDELYAVVDPDWIASNGQSPSGVDVPGLLTALSSVAA